MGFVEFRKHENSYFVCMQAMQNSCISINNNLGKVLYVYQRLEMIAQDGACMLILSYLWYSTLAYVVMFQQCVI